MEPRSDIVGMKVSIHQGEDLIWTFHDDYEPGDTGFVERVFDDDLLVLVQLRMDKDGGLQIAEWHNLELA